MQQRPLLVLPQPSEIVRPKGQGARPPVISMPGGKRQRRRLEEHYQRLSNALNAPGGLMSLRDDPANIAPERAIVFEVAGSVTDFYKAVGRIEGLDFLIEDDTDFSADEDFSMQDPEKAVVGKFYLAMPTTGALEEIMTLYRQWRRGRKLPRGSGPWKNLFNCLKTMRPWGPQDRISDADIAIWREEIADAGLNEIRIEAEFFFKPDVGRRNDILRRTADEVADLGGEIITSAEIPAIAYHAALIRLPAASMERLLAREQIAFVLADQIMFLRPQASLRAPRLEESPRHGRRVDRQAAVIDLPPIVGLLDGMPLQNHDLLANRLVVNDADGLEPISLVTERHHGTAMASLILHGDLNTDVGTLERPLYVHPVMFAGAANQDEQSHPDRLLVDTLYRAVVGMKDSDAPGGPSAPNVFIVNVSLGDARRLYAQAMSPLGKLFDFLAHRYNILFLISAGNITDPVTLAAFETMGQLEDAEPEAVTRAFLTAVRDSQAQRSLLAPAEGLNALTIGAAHHDDYPAGFAHAGSVAPYAGQGLPNVSSALGLGHRRVVKPDLLLPGGRERLRMRSNRPLVLRHPRVAQGCGLCAAAPDAIGARLSARTHLCGSSAATALASRAAHQIFDSMMDRDGGSNLSEVDEDYWPVMVKALLVHGARWDEAAANLVADVFGPAGGMRHVERVENVSRVLGYGMPEIQRVIECSSSQATIVGYGDITSELAHEYRIPLPACLDAVAEPRTVVVTLAWISPISNAHLDYRRAQLLLDLPDHRGVIGVRRFANQQPTDHASKRGSVIHEIYKGEEAAIFIDDGYLNLRVWCRERPNKLPLAEAVRYAVAVTIEAGVPLPVYEQTSVRLREGLRVR